MSLKAKEKRKENKHKLVPYDLSVRKPRSLGYKRLVYYIYYGKDADSLPEGNKEKQTNIFFRVSSWFVRLFFSRRQTLSINAFILWLSEEAFYTQSLLKLSMVIMQSQRKINRY